MHLIHIDLDLRDRQIYSTAERKQIIKKLLDENWTQFDIARQLNMSQSAVSQFVRRHNLKNGDDLAVHREFDDPAKQEALFKKCSCCQQARVAAGNRMLCAECAKKPDAQERSCTI